jgi:hypothetical protein
MRKRSVNLAFKLAPIRLYTIQYPLEYVPREPVEEPGNDRETIDLIRKCAICQGGIGAMNGRYYEDLVCALISPVVVAV